MSDMAQRAKGATPIDGPPPWSYQETMSDTSSILTEMNDRSREVFRRVVESYLNSGDPVGSRTLTRTMTEKLSAATIRNTMQDLEFLGLLDSPHVSAGRIPTQLGLRMFVDGLMEVGTIDDQDRAKIESSMGRDDGNVTSLLDQVGADSFSVMVRVSVREPTGSPEFRYDSTTRRNTSRERSFISVRIEDVSDILSR